MKRYRLTETADWQLQEIWRYSRERWGVGRADAYLAEIEGALNKAIKAPTLLRPRPELGEGLVARKVGSHVAYGVVRDDALLVIAVLHGRMDPKRHLLRNEG
jgi:toxin ParE1/3/4